MFVVKDRQDIPMKATTKPKDLFKTDLEKFEQFLEELK